MLDEVLRRTERLAPHDALICLISDDPAIIQAFAPALAPELMPAQGDAAAAALRLAASMIARNGQPGSILLIADSVAPDQVQPDLPRATILAPVAEGPELAALLTLLWFRPGWVARAG